MVFLLVVIRCQLQKEALSVTVYITHAHAHLPPVRGLTKQLLQ